jgi:competence ComEA-like helix-hairpin-helix protein
MRKKASILVGLLWCLALLSVLVIGMLHTSRLDLMVVKNHGDTIQAHYLALAGIEKAKALLYQDAIDRRHSAKNHGGELYDSPRQFRDVKFGRGEFRVFRQGRSDEGGGVIYGVADEESRLNINTASAEELGKLYRMTPEMVAAIQDWRDQDNTVTPNGAEAEYYMSLQPPYLPQNGPFQTVRELLMVRGVSRELFFGEDANQNGLLDPEEDDGNDTMPPDNRDGILDAGWSGIVTVDSTVGNVSASGTERVNVQEADQNSLTGVSGITADLAKAIVGYRDKKKLENIADLLDVVAVKQQNQDGTQPNQGRPGQPQQSDADLSGEKLISQSLLMDIADDVTTDSGQDLSGPVNINTASLAVLACLPGIDEKLAQAIINYRQSSGFFANIAWLLKVPGISQQVFKQAAPRITARSETFRILSEGKVSSTGARKRIQAIVHIGSQDVETLSYREDL